MDMFYQVSPDIHTKEWTHTVAAKKLLHILAGSTTSLEWGSEGQYVYMKEQNTPVILICDGIYIPQGLRHPPFNKYLDGKLG